MKSFIECEKSGLGRCFPFTINNCIHKYIFYSGLHAILFLDIVFLNFKIIILLVKKHKFLPNVPIFSQYKFLNILEWIEWSFSSHKTHRYMKCKRESSPKMIIFVITSHSPFTAILGKMNTVAFNQGWHPFSYWHSSNYRPLC